MITLNQTIDFARKTDINETVIYREYLQTLFLSRLYSSPKAKKIFFKGGTALHLLFKAPRFSEDLDFNVAEKTTIFLEFIHQIFAEFSQEEEAEFKERKTLAGKRFLLTAKPSILPYKVFINLDFSFREKTLEPQKSTLKTDYPILFNSYIYHLSREEIAAEKIRAIMSRKKGRDLYDLWFLLTQNVNLKNDLISQKLKYYKLKHKKEDILKRVGEFNKKDFILDLRPFVPRKEREKLAGFFDYLQDYLKNYL